MLNLNALAKQIYENAVSKGFYDTPPSVGTRFMLIISEASEALEADRKGKRASLAAYDIYKRDSGFDVDSFKNHVKDTLEDEIADVVIRVLDYCGYSGIDISHIEERLEESLGVIKGTIAERLEEELSTETISEMLLSITGKVYYASVSAKIEDIEDVRTELGEVIDECFCIAALDGFDLIRHIELKMQYNSTRERMHGKKY